MQQRTTNNFFPSSSLVLDTGFWMIDLRRLRKRLGGLCFSSLSFLLFFQKCSFTSVFWMNEGKSEQRRNTKMERVVRVKHLLTKTAHREQQQQFFPQFKKIMRTSNAPLCWRDRLQMKAKEGRAEWITVPSPQMAPCPPPVINRRWLPAVITVFKQLGPAWSNSLTAWALRAQALGFAGFGISAETSTIQDNWKPTLLSVISCLVLRGWRCCWFESS